MVAELIGSFRRGFCRCAGVDETSLYAQIPFTDAGGGEIRKRWQHTTEKAARRDDTLAFNFASEKYSILLQNVPPSITSTTNKQIKQAEKLKCLDKKYTRVNTRPTPHHIYQKLRT
jgi:hypothetical protein